MWQVDDRVQVTRWKVGFSGKCRLEKRALMRSLFMLPTLFRPLFREESIQAWSCLGLLCTWPNRKNTAVITSRTSESMDGISCGIL